MLSLPKSDMKDRVDVLRAPQAVKGGAILPLDESVAAFDIPCLILEASGSRANTMLGVVQQNAYLAYFDPEPSIKANDVLRERKSGARYTVRLVRQYPSPHNCDMQVVELSQDLASPQ
jgi:hypothetical protein